VAAGGHARLAIGADGADDRVERDLLRQMQPREPCGHQRDGCSGPAIVASRRKTKPSSRLPYRQGMCELAQIGWVPHSGKTCFIVAQAWRPRFRRWEKRAHARPGPSDRFARLLNSSKPLTKCRHATCESTFAPRCLKGEDDVRHALAFVPLKAVR